MPPIQNQMSSAATKGKSRIKIPMVSCGLLALGSLIGSPQLGQAGALRETDLPQAEQFTRVVFVLVGELATLGVC